MSKLCPSVIRKPHKEATNQDKG